MFLINHLKKANLYLIFVSFGCSFSIIFAIICYKNYVVGNQWQNAYYLAQDGRFDESFSIFSNIQYSITHRGNLLASYANALMQHAYSTNKCCDNYNISQQKKDELIKKAMDLYQTANKTCPDPNSFENLGKAYMHFNYIDQATNCWIFASNIRPWRLTPKFSLAKLFYQIGDTNNAIKYARLVVNTPMKKWSERGKRFKLKSQKMLVALGEKCDKPGLVVFDINDKSTWNEGKW